MSTEWDLAACIPHRFFFQGSEDILPDDDAAKEICATCPIIAECLAEALKTHEPFFVWGGKTPEERGVSARFSPPRHGTAAGHAWHRRNDVPLCTWCRSAYNEASRDRQRAYKLRKSQRDRTPNTGDGE